jgi:hypothetical protein
MEYNKIISVSGLGGLYELITSKADGAVVRSLEDNSTKFVSSRQHNFSHLESIEVFTVKDNANLSELFTAMKDTKEPIPDAKADGKQLKDYFKKIFPDMDFERVYTSDMKKMVKWYGILNQNKIDISSEKSDTDTDDNQKLKTSKKELAPVKEGKPVNPTTRKIESRGVK